MHKSSFLLVLFITVLFAASLAEAYDGGNTRARLENLGNGNYRLTCYWDGDVGNECADFANTVTHRYYTPSGVVYAQSLSCSSDPEHFTGVTVQRILGSPSSNLVCECDFFYKDYGTWNCDY